MAFGSYIRFFLGIVLAADVLRIWLTNSALSAFDALLALVYLILAVLWFAFRI